jgi:hypothetical protein
MATHRKASFSVDEDLDEELEEVAGNLLVQEDDSVVTRKSNYYYLLGVLFALPILIIVSLIIVSNGFKLFGLDGTIRTLVAVPLIIILFVSLVFSGAGFLTPSNIGPNRVYERGIAISWHHKYHFIPWTSVTAVRRKKHWFLGPAFYLGPWYERIYFLESMEDFDIVEPLFTRAL